MANITLCMLTFSEFGSARNHYNFNFLPLFMFFMGDICLERITVFVNSASHKMISSLICQCNEKIHKDIFMEHIFTALLNCSQILSRK